MYTHPITPKLFELVFTHITFDGAFGTEFHRFGRVSLNTEPF
jgi:hypothetical protein